MGAYPLFKLTKSISKRKAGAQSGGLETSGGVGTTPSIPCRLASLVLLNLKMAGGLKVGSPTIGGQKLQTYKEILTDYLDNHINGDNAFLKWDKAKHLMRNYAIKAWETKVRARGTNLCWLQKRHDKLASDLYSLPLTWPYREITYNALEACSKALIIATAKDMAARKEATEAKWIQMSGKPNKDFLAKPKGTRKRIGNMTVENTKDRPVLPCTDDITIILQNFVDYYEKLYEHKKVCPIALDKLIQNLTLSLDEEETEILEAPISEAEMLHALVASPKSKSPGTDCLLYECYKASPLASARILAGIGNLVSERRQQPASWS